jgi:hypothetical protein
MATSVAPLDALVLGEHPAAYLAAALLKHKTKLRVAHTTIPGESEPDRLVLINPALFSLHPLLEPLKRKLEMTPVYGLQFLSDDPATRSEHRSKSALAYVSTYKAVRQAMQAVAESQEVQFLTPKTLEIHRLDEKGADVTAGKNELRPTALIVGGHLPEPEQQRLGLPDSWGADLVHRYTFLKLPAAKWGDLGNRPVMPMSLNLKEMLCWAWLLPGPKGMQLAVEQPVETVGQTKPLVLLAHWAEVLRKSGLLDGKGDLPLDHAESRDIPLAGALAHEGVGNRTLLVGPAGGFYSACSEDIYPNCWSAIYAADALKKAFKELHLQDALQAYRHRWRTTLGDYLRGPQQNFRFLLPLVYRNQVMTSRLTEAILLGKSVVR